MEQRNPWSTEIGELTRLYEAAEISEAYRSRTLTYGGKSAILLLTLYDRTREIINELRDPGDREPDVR